MAPVGGQRRRRKGISHAIAPAIRLSSEAGKGSAPIFGGKDTRKRNLTQPNLRCPTFRLPAVRTLPSARQRAALTRIASLFLPPSTAGNEARGVSGPRWQARDDPSPIPPASLPPFLSARTRVAKQPARNSRYLPFRRGCLRSSRLAGCGCSDAAAQPGSGLKACRRRAGALRRGGPGAVRAAAVGGGLLRAAEAAGLSQAGHAGKSGGAPARDPGEAAGRRKCEPRVGRGPWRLPSFLPPFPRISEDGTRSKGRKLNPRGIQPRIKETFPDPEEY